MIEIPEAVTLSIQLSETFLRKTVTQVRSGISPHKFAWYYGDPQSYSDIAVGKTFRGAKPVGGMVEADLEGVRLLFSEGVSLRRLNPGDSLPEKRQMEVTFSDGIILVVSVQMYGGMGAFLAGRNDNPYYLISQQKPSPLEDKFDALYFDQLISAPGAERLSAKGFLATEQRIPGLGNGVLQDILYQARVNPRRKVATLDDRQRERLFGAVKSTLREMSESQGRDTELDLFGKPGRYRTIMSRHNAGKPCPTCGSPIQKAAYMGGSVYFCQRCQP
jgi:formamidopyrimidine-DNA glycosylase